ncbi:hypothetical protein VNI00_008518 [Paramarasmius palmivorus]|uniref:Zn(2)-C6 fungal-type domain-containing protein n=1 Tax=Paramarasmius palmivorus TaxID=297713 RepID=A0AAW0CVL8_9AGAR
MHHLNASYPPLTTTNKYPSASPSYCQVLRTEAVHDEESGRRATYYWQLQCYHDVPDVSPSHSNDSSYADTVREINDNFYMTFPDAPRPLPDQRHWSPYPIPKNSYIEGTGFYPPGQRKACPSMDLSGSSALCRRSDERSTDQTTSSSMPSISIGMLASCGADDDNEALAINSAGVCSHTNATTPSTESTTLSSRAVDGRVMGSNGPLSPMSVEDDDQGYDHLDTESFLSDDEAHPQGEAGDDDNGRIEDLNLVPSQVTGTWPSLRVRSHESVSPSSSRPSSSHDATTESQLAPPTLTTYGRRTAILPATPPPASATTAPQTQDEQRQDNSNAPALMRLSPLPINRRPVEKKKTQTLACNFCRGRKIACGPPVAGTVEKTCK